jgi:hypothetical protein
MAYKSFVIINQLNGALRVCHFKQVGPFIYKVIFSANNGNEDWQSLFKRVQNNTAANVTLSFLRPQRSL